MSAFELNDTDGDFSITLGPGEIKYFRVKDFLEAKVDEVISKLNSLPNGFSLEFPNHYFNCWGKYFHLFDAGCADTVVSFIELDGFFVSENWEQKLRAYHGFANFCFSNSMSSFVYASFHEWLKLNDFAFEECLNAWIKDAKKSTAVLNSYRESKEHKAIQMYYTRVWIVFAKTPFVKDKLQKLEAAADDKKTALEMELLRKSKFDCFVYLMEDLRNKSFKIGKSKTPGKRERTLQSEMPQIVMRFSIPAEERHEKELHEHFSEKRKRGEWFELSNNDLLWIVSYLKNNGDGSRATVDYQWLGIVSFNESPKNG